MAKNTLNCVELYFRGGPSQTVEAGSATPKDNSRLGPLHARD